MSLIHFLLLVAQHGGEAQHPVTGIHGAEKSPEEHWALFVWRNLAKVTNLHTAGSAGVCAALQRSCQQGRKKETIGDWQEAFCAQQTTALLCTFSSSACSLGARRWYPGGGCGLNGEVGAYVSWHSCLMGMQIKFWWDRFVTLMAVVQQMTSKSRKQVLLVQVNVASRGYSVVTRKESTWVENIPWGRRTKHKFFTGNLFNKMFFPVLIFCRSESTVLDFRSFPDCTQGQFQPLWRAADLPVGCLWMYLSQELCLTKESCCNLPFLLLGFTGHE